MSHTFLVSFFWGVGGGVREVVVLCVFLDNIMWLLSISDPLPLGLMLLLFV